MKFIFLVRYHQLGPKRKISTYIKTQQHNSLSQGTKYRNLLKNLFQIFLSPTDKISLMKQTTELKFLLNCSCRKCKPISINLIQKVNCLIAHSFRSITQRHPITESHLTCNICALTYLFSSIEKVVFHDMNDSIFHRIIQFIKSLFL